MSLEISFEETNHPAWFYRELIEDLLPWDRGRKMNFQEFHKQYTLHDSYWIGMFLNIAYEPDVTLAMSWDAVWLPNEIKQSSEIVNDWPYLFIQLSGVEEISPSCYVDVMGACRTISGCDIEAIDGKKLLVIDDVYGSQISIVYRGQETFLAMEKNQHILAI